MLCPSNKTIPILVAHNGKSCFLGHAMSPLQVSWSVLHVSSFKVSGWCNSCHLECCMCLIANIKTTLEGLMLAFKCYSQKWHTTFGLKTNWPGLVAWFRGTIITKPDSAAYLVSQSRELWCTYSSRDYFTLWDPCPHDSLQLMIPPCQFWPKCSILPGKHYQRPPAYREICCDFHHLLTLNAIW